MNCGYDIVVDLETDKISYSHLDKYTGISFRGSPQVVNFDPEDSTPNISGLDLNISQICNMGCTYCFANQGLYDDVGLMSLEMAKKSVDLFNEISVSNSLTIKFFGGEPLLNFKIMKDLVEYSARALEDRHLDFEISTNGTIINEEILNFFKDNPIRIQVSVDGDKNYHDIYRRFRDGKPSYETIIKNLKIMKDFGLNPEIRATLCHKNTDIKVFLKYFTNELGIKSKISPVMSEDVNVMLGVEDFAEIYRNYLDLYREVRVTKKYKAIFYNSILSAMILHCFDANSSSRPKPRPYFCGAGIRMISVDMSGNIYPCHGFIGQDEFRMGNVYDSLDILKLKKFLKRINLAHKEGCLNCFARNFCGGGCSHCFQFLNGDVNLPHSSFCEFIRTMYKLAIIFYVYMRDQGLPEDLVRYSGLIELNDLLMDR